MVQQPAWGPSPQVLRVKVDWRVADDFPISYANEFMVQIVRDEFVLTLGQLAPPALVAPTHEEIEAFPEKISPRVVGRVAVAPSRLRALVGLLQQQLALYESGIRGLENLSETSPDIQDDGQEA